MFLSCIVLDIRLEEKARIKADIYWPMEEGAVQQYGCIMVKNVKTRERIGQNLVVCRYIYIYIHLPFSLPVSLVFYNNSIVTIY